MQLALPTVVNFPVCPANILLKKYNSATESKIYAKMVSTSALNEVLKQLGI